MVATNSGIIMRARKILQVEMSIIYAVQQLFEINYNKTI